MDEIWNKIHKQGAWGQYPSEHVIRFVARNYYDKDRKNVKILDFGCGGGAHTWYLAREGFDTYAFDGAEDAVNNTAAKLKREGFEANLKVTDAVSPDYPNDYFDAVIDNVCIYANRFSEIEKMYESIYEILKSGGKLFSSCFSKNTYGYGLGIELEKDTYTDITDGSLCGRGIAHFYDKDEFSDLLSKIGFKNIQVDTITYTDRGKVVELYAAVGEK